MAHCIGFDMKESAAAWEHMDLERIEDYGDEAYGHLLHTWDDGGRTLLRCKKCGGYVLCQKSEYHGFDDDDSYYRDYFPVESPEDADEVNRVYNGTDIELKYPAIYLMRTDGKLSWSQRKQ